MKELTTKKLPVEMKRKAEHFNAQGFHLCHIEKWGVSWNQHSLVTLQRQSLSRILYYSNLYKQIVGVPGCILEFGVQWGAGLAQLISLRGIYEPYNYSRHIYGLIPLKGL